jgi:hypothetical protein
VTWIRFDSQIAAGDPAEVSDVICPYISNERTEPSALSARTFDDILAAAVTAARVNLNRVCGFPGHGAPAA